jgi:CHRD domain-containing protein
MSRRLLALVATTCFLLLGLGSAIAIGGGGDDDQSNALFADLSGRNELSPTGQRGAGDPDGFGSASFTFDGGQVCFGITVANIATPTAAHIHRGGKKENGPIVVPLVPPTAGDPGASSGCVAISDALAAEIKDHPERFYANVHTTDFPGGAIRGQLDGDDD